VRLQYGAAVVIEKAGVAGTRSWLLANIAMLGYLPALGLRMVLPLVFSVVLSNGLGLVAASMFYIGCARFWAGPAMPGHWPCWCWPALPVCWALPCCWTASRCGW
jgi:hypothetical protein